MVRFRELALPFTTAIITTTSKWAKFSTTRTTYEESWIIPLRTPTPSIFLGRESLVPKPSSTLLTSGVTVHPPQVTTVVTVKDGKTYSEAYTAVLFPGYDSDKSTKTVTTTDNNGGAVLAVIGIGGLGWLAALPKPGLPVINPPNTPPAPGPENIRTWDEPSRTKATTDPKTSTSSSSSLSSSSSSSSTPTETATVIVDNIPNTPRKYFDQHLKWRKKRVLNQLTCADPAEYTYLNYDLYFERDPGMYQLKQKCKEIAGKKIDRGSNYWDFISYGSGSMMKLNITLLEPRLSGMVINEADCNYFFGRTLDDCDRWPAWKKRGGSIVDAGRSYHLQMGRSGGAIHCANNHPTPNDGNGLVREDAFKAIDDFCETWKGTKIGKDNPLEIKIPMPSGDSDAIIHWKFLTDQNCPKDGTVTIDKEICKYRLQKRSIDECNIFFKRPFGKHGGKIIDWCAESGIRSFKR